MVKRSALPLGVEVFALAFVCGEKIEAGPRRIVVLTHVPFAQVGGRVAVLMKALRPVPIS